MTKPEITGVRDLKFSRWIRSNLPDSHTRFWVTDLDFILVDISKRSLMLIEVKTHRARVRPFQIQIAQLLDAWIRWGIAEYNLQIAFDNEPPWTYYGWHFIQFEKTGFDDGKCWLDGREISEEELIKFLSMECEHTQTEEQQDIFAIAKRRKGVRV